MGLWTSLLIMIVGVCLGGLFTWYIGIILSRRQKKELANMLHKSVIEREHVTLNEELLMTQLLAEKIQEAWCKPDIIVAICPGGAMISEWLSRRFWGSRNAPTPVQLLYMHSKNKDEVNNTHMVEVNAELTAISPNIPKNSNVLLVNDISRGGHTLYSASKYLREHFPEGNVRSATLICNKMANKKPDYYVAITKKEIWFNWKHYD
jgi:hypoxanthine phosphoribosyltransferase